MSCRTILTTQHFKKFITRRERQHDYRFHSASTLNNLHIYLSMGCWHWPRDRERGGDKNTEADLPRLVLLSLFHLAVSSSGPEQKQDCRTYRHPDITTGVQFGNMRWWQGATSRKENVCGHFMCVWGCQDISDNVLLMFLMLLLCAHLSKRIVIWEVLFFSISPGKSSEDQYHWSLKVIV